MATAKKTATKTVAKKVATKAVVKPVVAKKATAKKATAVAKKLEPTAAEKAQMKAIDAVVPKLPKQTKEEKAAAKKALEEKTLLMARCSSVIVPTWFGQADVAKTINKPKLPPEAALCLVYIGASGPEGRSQVGIEWALRPSGFDRSEAWLFAEMGCASLIGGKLAKSAKQKAGEKHELANLTLTKKGQELFDLIKRVVLQPVNLKAGFPG